MGIITPPHGIVNLYAHVVKLLIMRRKFSYFNVLYVCVVYFEGFTNFIRDH